jgi:hypothetical protein
MCVNCTTAADVRQLHHCRWCTGKMKTIWIVLTAMLCLNSYAMLIFPNLSTTVILHIFWCVEYLLWALLTVWIRSEKWFIRNPKSVTWLGRLQLLILRFFRHQSHHRSWAGRATGQITGHTSHFVNRVTDAAPSCTTASRALCCFDCVSYKSDTNPQQLQD